MGFFSNRISAIRAKSRSPELSPISESTPFSTSDHLEGPGSLDLEKPLIEIPVCDPSPDAYARQTAFERGQHLARQDAWEELANEIQTAEAEHQLTPGLASVAQILAEGARADITRAVHQAAMRGEPRTDRAILATLEANLEDIPGNSAMAYVIAKAHVDVAQYWRGASQVRDLAPQRRDAFEQHIQAATALAEQFDPFEHHSPLWAQIRCDVLAADPAPARRVIDDYEDLIDLDPYNPQHLIDLGRDLLPRRYGSLEKLDLQARRCVGQFSDVWGTGAYTWVFFGALQADAGAFRRLDPELFIEGVHNILALHPTQHMANVMAAFFGLSIASPSDEGSPRHRMMSCLRWIVQDHLREVHPLVWAHAPVPGKPDITPLDEVDMIELGRTRAIGTLAQHFAPSLENGLRVVFSPEGIDLRKAT